MDKKQVIESNGKERAFPTGLSQKVDGVEFSKLEGGLTKREYFAAVALQGLVTKYDNSHAARYAVDAADALLMALDESE